MTTFQPHPGDACTWVAEAAFYDFDDELEEQDLSLQDLQTGYETLQKAFTEANIPFAAIGGFVFSVLGGREDLTHDVDFQINSTPVKLFTKLRTMEKLRLKIGLQTDNFRVHCNIGANKWVGIDMLTTKNNVNGISNEYKGVRMLNVTALLETKLKSFAARGAARDVSDIMYLVEMHAERIDASRLDQTMVNYFLENAELEGKSEKVAEKVYLYYHLYNSIIMAVVGIDFGTLHSLIGVARHRGIDIIANEVSNRTTPSLVAFGPKQRAIGEAAKTQETSNFKNTIGSLKRLIGRTLNDTQVQDVEKKFINAKLVDVNGSVGAEVTFRGDKSTYSATQLTAMYFGKLRDITANELKTGVTDVVIAVPGWFTDIQRRAVIDAASIANLNVLRLINDTTATALGYGITKSDLPEAENPRHVIFVDVGHADMSVAVVAFSKGQLTVKSTAYERNLGGRDIDYALVEHFSNEFKAKYKIDVMSNPKATFRLTAGCEKLKKVLSANAEAPLNVESIMNDVDASSKLSRDEMEGLISHVLDRIPGPLLRALTDSGLTIEQIDAIELVGGSTRVPSIRQRIQEAFPGKALSTTLNQDEAIARGATFACAMLSPVFRVRDFHMTDIHHYPIKVQWSASPSDPDDDTELLVFPQGNTIPSTKVLSFYRKESFSIEAVYAHPDLLPGAINPWIANFTAKEVPAAPNGDATCVRLKTRLNLHGIMSFEGAYVEEIEEREEAPAPMDVDGAAADGAAPAPPPKKKRIVKKKEIPIIATNSSLDKSIVESYRELESQLHAADKLVMDTEDRKNALEEYVYDTRGKLDDRYAPYVKAQEKSSLLAALSEAEDWLYTEEGEDATKSAYVSRLDALKVLGDPITFRYKEVDERKKSTAQLRETINTYMSQATSTEEKYAHIDEKDKQSVIEKVATIQKWLEDQTVRQSERPKDVDPVLTSAEIEKKRDELIYFAIPILTKPKPKPPVIPSAPGSGTQTPKTDTPKPGTPAPEGPPPPTKEGDNGPSEMDID